MKDIEIVERLKIVVSLACELRDQLGGLGGTVLSVMDRELLKIEERMVALVDMVEEAKAP